MSDTAYCQNHKPFQFGTNPSEMTPFERSLVEKEKKDREQANKIYVRGIQGVDGDGAK